jgi:hypothetical protein
MMATRRKFVDTEMESADWAGWLTQVIHRLGDSHENE